MSNPTTPPALTIEEAIAAAEAAAQAEAQAERAAWDRRLTGTARAQRKTTNAPWTAAAEAWVVARREDFTSFDLVSDVGLPTGKTSQNANSLVGAFLQSCARRGLVRKVGTRQSRLPSSHSVVSIWRPVV